MPVLSGLIAFLISNGPTLLSTGMSVAGLVSDVMGLINKGGDISKDEFNAFVDKCLGKDTDLDAIIAQAKAELA